jgi:hypothetical protein
MSSAMKGKKHEYLTLKVDEIAVVDDAANLKEFAVIKSKTTQEGDEKMAQEKDVKKETNEEVEVKDGNTSAENTESKDDSVQKASVNVDELVAQVVKSLEEKQEAKPEEDKEVEKKEDKEEDSDSGEEIEAKKTEDDKEEPEVDEEAETTKMLDTLLSSIQKAKSLTPSRVKTLKQVSELLNGFLTEVESGEDKKVSKSNDDKEEEKPKPKVDLGEIKKLLEEKIGEVVEATKALDTRIEEIEKTRVPSASLNDGADTETVEKKDSNFWSGVPVG